jgi:hypothetical protein
MAEPAASVFSEPAPSTESTPTAASIEDWVGEGKKFSTVEDLVKSYSHAQTHIANLEETQEKQREDLVRAKTIEEMFEAYKTPQSTQVTPDKPDGDLDPLPAGITPEEVSALAQQRAEEIADTKLSHYEEERKRRENKQFADSTLLARLGDDASVAVREKARALINADTSDFSVKSKPTRNFEYYEQMRKSDPGSYYKPSIQAQMHRDAQEYGDDF